MSRLSEQLAIWLGVDVLNKKHSDRQVRHLQRNFAHFPCDLVIDCGANRGQFARECRLAGYRGAIRSLEPLPAPFTELSAKASCDRRAGISHVFTANGFNARRDHAPSPAGAGKRG